MIFISTIERNILISYLNDFEKMTDEENIDEFSEIILSLYDKKNNTANTLENLKGSNDKLESYLRDFRDNLNTRFNHTQKLLENYNQVLDDNKRLNNINDNLKKSNESLDDKLKKMEEDTANNQINTLKRDVEYYERILAKLTIIINSLEDESYSLSESLNIDTIQSSPYYRLIESSGQFDRGYYNDKYLDDESIDEIAHFLQVGSSLDYNPNMEFNTKWYRTQYLDDDKSINPFVEYLSMGMKNGNMPTDYSQPENVSISDSQEYHIIDESGYFDSSYYRKNYEIDAKGDALAHYMTKGYRRGNMPSRDFDLEWYEDTYSYHESSPLFDYVLNSNKRLNKKAENIYTEYEEYDITDSQLYHILDEGNLLDVSWYFTQYNSYQDDLVADYVQNKNRYISQLHKDYIQENPTSDVYHYIIEKLVNENQIEDYSKKLEIDIKDSIEYTILSEDDLFDEKYYLDKNGDVKRNTLDPVYHYMTYGINEKRNPSKDFNTEQYYKKYPYIKNKRNPLVEYIYNNKNDLYDDVEEVSIQDSQEYAILDDARHFDKIHYMTEYEVDCEDSLSEFMTNGFNQGRNPTTDIQIDDLDLDSITDYVEYIISLYRDEEEKDKKHTDEYLNDYKLLKESIYFDENYYIKHNPNIDEGIDAIDYYLSHEEYYPTSRYIDVKSYIDNNPDLKHAGIDPLIHFIRYGVNEGRTYKRPKLSPAQFDEYPQLYELYDIIYESNLFDESYYMKENPGLLESNEDSIIHYLRNGVDMDLNPSAIFSTKRYLKYNPDIKKTGFNPLYHYLKSGLNEKRFMFLPEEYYPNNILEQNDFDTTNKILNKLQEATTIILPVGDDVENFRITIQSILENTKCHYRLILLKTRPENEDKTGDSTDDINNLADELERLSEIEFIEVVDANDDYDKTLCECIHDSESDVVLLDKNTILTPHWLVKLTTAAYTNRQAACVSAMTNSTDLLTESNRNKLKVLYDEERNNIENLNDKSRQLQQTLNNLYIKRKTAEKHCTYIKRQALDTIDYGKINDDITGKLFDQLYENGYIAITDPSTFVYTRDTSVNQFDTNKYNDVSLSRLNKALDEVTFDNKRYERILCFTQMQDSKPVIDDDIHKISNKYQTYILAVDDDKIYLFRYSNSNFALIDNIKTDYSYDMNFFYKVYINILINLKVDLIYTKTHKRLFHPTNRKFTSILEFNHHFEVEEIHESIQYNKSFRSDVEKLFKTHYEYDEIVDRNVNLLDFKDRKVAVYTAVTGSYDEPVIPTYVHDEFDYICFTDNPELKSDFWDIRLMEESSLDNIRKVRSYKILAHKYLSDYDYSLWIDTNIELTDSIIDYVHKYSRNNKLLCIKHIERDCIYDEAHTCISSAKDTDIDVINNQMQKYEEEGYPHHNGLISSGVLFRNHNDPEVIKLMEDWFGQLLSGSYRDQLSFNYVCWKNNFTYDSADLFIIKNSYMQLHDHMSKGYVLRNIDIDYNKDYDLKYVDDDVENILNAFKKVSVIIAIDNLDSRTFNTIDKVIAYTQIEYDLLVVVDNDDDYDTLTDRYSSNDNVHIIKSDSSGKISKINVAINHSSNDIMILDEHSLVSPKYMHKLVIKAYSQEMIASVSPITNYDLCNQDGYDSSLELGTDSLISDARAIEQKARDATIITPLIKAECAYIKKDAIYASGFFDVEYDTWEYALMDYSLRLLKKGWHNTIAPSVYIRNDDAIRYGYNLLSNDNITMDDDASTNDDIDYAHDKKVLLTRYYEYKNSINEFEQSIDYNDIKRILRYALDDNKSKKRILYVLHDGVGGTLHTNLELMKNVNPHMESYLLVTSTTKVELYKYNPQTGITDTNPDMEFKNNLDLLRTWKLHSKYTLLNTSNNELKKIYFNILSYLNVDIIHIRHLIMSTFDLPKLADTLGIPVILSFHDFYYICPSHNLVDDNRNYCGGICPPLYDDNTLGGQCNIIGELNIPQARSIVHWWKDEVSDMFKNVNAFITTSKSAYDLYTSHYPQLEEEDFRIIEHGRDLKTPDSIKYVTPIDSKKKIKILFPGHIGYTKGYELIKKIKEYDVDDKLEFHYMGSIGGHTDLEEIGINHGIYKRSEFEDIVHDIKPHFIGIFSIWPETYCHTLTEGWASGIPILAVDMGAVGERIRNNGGGFLIPNNPKEAYEKIIKISHNRRAYMKKARKITEITFKTTKQMGCDYMNVYNDYINY